MWRRRLHDEYGLFDPFMKSAGDYEFWLRVCFKEKFLHIPETLGLYLLSPSSVQNSNSRLSAQEAFEARKRYWPNSVGPLPPNHPGFFVNNIKKSFDYTNKNKLLPLEDNSLVSVIIPTFNRGDLLIRALDSLSKQTYSNWEAIVVNDGGASVYIDNELYDSRIKTINLGGNFGQASARNIALKIATGEMICFLDDDDVYLPNHLNTIQNGLKSANFVYTLAEYVIENANGEVLRRESRYKGIKFTKERLFVDNFIPINTWGIRSDYLKQNGFFDESMSCLEDWDLLIRLSRDCDFYHIPVTTAIVHLRQDSKDGVSSKNLNNYYEVYSEIYQKYGFLNSQAVKSLQENKLVTLSKQSFVAAPKVESQIDDYLQWQKKHRLYESDGQILAERMHTWIVSPNFLILTVYESTNTALLADTIDSLNRQFYNQWSLAIISAMPTPDPLFDEMEMVHWLQVDNDPYQALNQVLANVDAFDWVAVIPPGAVFSENALSVVSNYINKKPEWCFIYSDEDSIDSNSSLTNPLFKPDFNLELLRSMPYIGDACFVRKSVIDELGGYCGLAGVLNWDLSFKIFECLGASSIGHVAEVLFHRPKSSISDAEQQYLLAAEKLTVLRHLERLEIKAAVTEGLVPNTYFVDYPLLSQPLVSIVLTIFNAEQLSWVNECIEVLAKNTDYVNYEIILTSLLPEADVLKVVGELAVADKPILYLPFQGDLISPLSNQALPTLNGDYVLLFSPDLIVLHHHWLETMMAQGLRDEVGIVGARIVDMDKNVHHAGIVLGMGDFGVADYPNRNLPMNQPGYMNRAAVVQNFSAVSTQCFLVKKQLLLELPVNAKTNVFDHIEFCLNVRQKGYAIVWTPFVNLMLSHQVLQECSMDQLRSDADQVIKNWLPQLANDPAYNRNLSLKHRHFQIETETDVTWNIDFHDRPRVYAFPANDSGVGEYRVRSPLRALTHAAKIQSSLLPNHSDTLIPDIVEIERAKPDVLLLQNGTASYLLHAWEQYRKFNDVFMVYSQDDLIYMLPGKHPLQGKWPKDLRKRLRRLLEHSDRLIVATEPLKEEYSRWISDVKIVPNYLEKAKWLDLTANIKSREGKKMRVGWAGGAQHQGDLEFILPVVEATKNELDWIFMGMCPDQIRPFIKEYHAGVHFDLYPQKLADLDLDLAIAPLEYNNFNMAKTNLRLLEYGVLGWPVVCSDITPYRNAPVTRVSNNVNHWIKAIREKVNEPDALVKEGQVLKQWVLDNYLLEDHLDQWLEAITPN
jgi:glycosyltransferase involved in cell wall biosynthesis